MTVTQFTLDDKHLLHQFEQLGKELYGNEKGNFVAQINRINTFLFVKGVLVVEHDRVLARCVLYDPQIRLDNKAVVFFGNFEAIDQRSGSAILKAVIDFAKEHYPDYELIGPVNGNTWNDYRIALDHQQLLFPNDICSDSFYPEILSANGFGILYRYYTNIQTNFDQDKTFRAEGFSPVFFTKEIFTQRLPEIYALTMEAFRKAPLFSPVSETQFIAKQLQLLPQMDMDLIPFIIDAEQHIVAYAFCYFGFERNTLVVKTIARKSERRFAGLGRLISAQIIKIARERGVTKILHAFMHESNSSNRLSADLNAERIKNYALYKLKEK